MNLVSLLGTVGLTVEELLGIIPTDIRQPLDMREVLLRIVDGSRLQEFKPLYGTGLITAWAYIHGIIPSLPDPGVHTYLFISTTHFDLPFPFPSSSLSSPSPFPLSVPS